ncbi:nucleolar complex-associated protein 3 [Rhizopus microsporus var. microsporus]|nr:nucleolar complex-associated protein 3 [Rhizopus microsporus var. microsporus]
MPAKKGNSKPAKTAKKPKQTNGKKKSKDKVKEFVAVPEKDDYEISDEDLEFFAENKGFTSFLTSLDAKELTRNTVKKPKAPVKKPAVKQQQSGLESSDEESLDNFEEPDSDEELDNFEEPNSDNEQVSDVEQELEDMSEEKMSEMLDLGSKKKKAATKHDSDEEMDYETKPRKIADEWAGRAKSTKLPIKLPGGKIIQAEKEEAEEKDEDEEMEEVESDQEEDHVEEEKEEEEEEEEVKVSKKQHLINKKEELATIATNLQEDPEEHIGELKTLRSIYRDDNPIVRKLALLTQLAIYKDIIPGYRIRPLTEAEEEQKVSKDVKKLREYEKSLLMNYEQYLKDLTVLTSKKKAEEDPALSLVATKCLCELLVSKTHFNFRLEIMVSLVTRMSTVQWNEGAELCRKALIEVFENDESGKYSLDAVKMVTRMVKSKSYIVSENAINLFLHLRLKDEMVPEASKKNDDEVVGKKRKNKDKPFLTKKAKKALKETKEIEKEFREAEAVVSKEEKEKNHSETLKLIFAFYFRILKKQVTSPLLPAVLEGLSMFAHLINVDMFDDLLNALRDVMRSFEDTNAISRTSSGTRKRLLCIITAFELLSGQGEMVTYDLKEFYTEIYNILFKATYHTAIEEKPESQDMTESEMIVKGLELMFLKKRQIPIDRLGAFIKRFALVALNMPTKTVLQCLHLIHKLVQKDHRLDALLQSEDRASNGIYAPLLNDPELCNPFGTSLYELFLYQNHYDPNVRRIAKELQQTSR